MREVKGYESPEKNFYFLKTINLTERGYHEAHNIFGNFSDVNFSMFFY